MHPQSLFGKLTPKVGGTTVTLGRADVLYNEWRDDQSFNSTGESIDRCLARRGAFHSFERGPAVWLLSVEALRPAAIDWTGLPLYFYARDGRDAIAQLHRRAGKRAAGATGQSALAVVVGRRPARHRDAWPGRRRHDPAPGRPELGAHGRLSRPGRCRRARRVQANPIQAGEIIDAAVVIYPDAKAEQIKAAQKALEKEGRLGLPAGWRASWPPTRSGPASATLPSRACTARPRSPA